jgi:pyridoxine 5-phosphate synthase
MSVVDEIKKIIDHAQNNNLLINAGHDLNLNNLNYLVEIGNINEVSIGHAIIIDSLHYGFEKTISKYLNIIRK